MGFMAGFGESFSRSFEQQRERSAQREDDLFRARFQILAKKKEQDAEWAREDAKLVGQAKNIVQASGQPPEVMAWAYNALRSGVTYDDVLKQAQTGKFNVKKAQDTAVPVEGASEAPQEPIDEQMASSGIAQPPAPPAAPAAPPAPQEEEGGLLSKIFPGMKKFSPAAGGGRERRVNDRLTEVMGEDVSQVEKPYEAPSFDDSNIEFTPGAPEREADPLATPNQAQVERDAAAAALAENPSDPSAQARLKEAERRLESVKKAEQFQSTLKMLENGQLGENQVVAVDKYGNIGPATFDPQTNLFTDIASGQILEGGRQMQDKEMESYANIDKTIGDKAKEYDQAASNFISTTRAAVGMRDAAVRNEAVLQPWTSGMAQFVNKLGHEVTAAMDLVNQTVGDPKTLSNLEIAKAKLEKAQGTGASELENLAIETALFRAQKAMFVYHLAASKGQSGRSLAEAERTMFGEIIEGANSLAQFDNIMAGLLLDEKKTLEDTAKAIPELSGIKSHKDFYGYAPHELELTPIEQRFQGDDRVKGYLDNLAQFKERQDKETEIKEKEGKGAGTTEIPAGLPEGTVQEGMTADGRPQYRLPNGKLVAPKAQQ